MARRFRLQFPDARYHIINPGNFRHPVFSSAGACRAFERSLDEAARRFRWLVYAYVVMSNHDHLAWKIDLACRLRTVAAAPYRWIAETLNMGASSSVRAYLARLEWRSAG